MLAEAERLLEDKHPQPEAIKGAAEGVERLWADLSELAGARQEALVGARQVGRR